MLTDSHCHLTDERIVPFAEEIISSMADDGLENLITVGYDKESSLGGLAVAESHDRVYCTLGVHPHDADKADEATYDLFRTLARTREKVVGIGEIGLDYYYDLSPREVQKKVFAEQLQLAYECCLPVCLHVRDAYGDALEVLKENERFLSYGVLLHCYSGSAEMVKEFLRFDAYFSFGGAITFKNAHRNLEALAAVPRDRLLLETDCPYMTPVPFRGQVNFPKYVAIVRDKVAATLGTSAEEIELITTKNTKRLFKRMK